MQNSLIIFGYLISLLAASAGNGAPMDIKAITGPTPPKGIYAGIPDRIYHHTWKYCNKSRLDYIFDQSEAHCKYAIDNPGEESDALKFGRAMHTLVLEPTKFDSQYVVTQTCIATKKGGMRCDHPGKLSFRGEWFCLMHAPKDRRPDPLISISPAEMFKMRSMREKLYAIPQAKDFLESKGHNEVSHVWQDAETGIWCKARMDLLRESWDAVGDLKSTDSASPRGFTYSITKYGYARQAAWYLDARTALEKPVKFFTIFAMEKEPPFEAGIYTISEDAVKVGRDQNRELLRRYAAAMETGNWPGYSSTGFQDIGLTGAAMYSHYRAQGLIQ